MSIILSRRKYVSGGFFKLNFDTANNDYATFGTNGGSWIDFDDFTLEVKFSNLNTISSTVGLLVGQHRAAAATDRWFVSYRGSDDTFFIRVSNRNMDFTDTATSGIIKIVGTGSGLEVFLDDVSQNTAAASTNSASASYLMNIGRDNDSSGTTLGTNYLDGTIHYVNILAGSTTKDILLDEGSGASISSEDSTSGTIFTSNGGGLSYINATMWEADV